MMNLYEIEEIILGMAEIVKEKRELKNDNHEFCKRCESLENQLCRHSHDTQQGVVDILRSPLISIVSLQKGLEK